MYYSIAIYCLLALLGLIVGHKMLPCNYFAALATMFLLAGGIKGGLLPCDKEDCTELEICRKSSDSRQAILLLGLFPCNTDRFRARGLTPAALMAINQINRHSSLLPGFELKILFNNSMVSLVFNESLCVTCVTVI